MNASACPICHRRRFLAAAMAGSATLFTAPGAFAEALQRTPAQTEGPFYPDRLPLDTDNDLLILNDAITPADGEVTHLHGTVRTTTGAPVRNALVEIWQVDVHGSYIHTRGATRSGQRDAHFQGYGRFLTDAAGTYRFRTIKPVPYGPRTPHIHVAVSQGERRLLTTQCYPKDTVSATDGVLRRTPADLRGALIVPFLPMEGAPAGELQARFDIVLGHTPES